MNYEEKYKQAFERAKERYSACSAPALLEYIFPELKENEDERIRKAIICGMNALKENQKSETFATIPIDDCIAWLEKQGEHAELNQSEVTKAYGQELEPKFHPGDWIIDNEYGEVLKVTKADANSYEITTQDGEALGGILKEDVECNHRIWTIQDANDGDVLVSDGKHGQEVGIVKEFIGKYGGHDKCFETYCYSDLDGIFRIGEYMGGTSIHPATKEQRDTLMEAMADAGWEFDFEKKELKKIKPKKLDPRQGD